MDLYMARQPIFNRKKSVFGYELLFRDGIQSCFPEVDGAMATSCVLSQSFLGSDIDQIVQKKKALINFPQNLLINRTPLLFSKERLIVEILETVIPTSEVIEALKDLFLQGYVLTLDDFIFSMEYKPIYPFIKIIKIDIRETPFDQVSHIRDALKSYPIKYLAEKVEKQEEFQRCLDLGFDYFQGYFFCEPETISSKRVSSQRLPLIQLLAEIAQEEIRIPEIERIIAHDVTISYGLLRYINSAFLFRGQEISSIRQALLRLGDAGIRRFIPILAMSHIGLGKPSELIRTGVVRAKFCEMLSMDLSKANSGFRNEASEWFLTGLFSVIGAILDEPIETILAKISISLNIRMALSKNMGPMADGLALIKGYETGDWDQWINFANRLKIPADSIPGIYWDAVSWADELTSVL